MYMLSRYTSNVKVNKAVFNFPLMYDMSIALYSIHFFSITLTREFFRVCLLSNSCSDYFKCSIDYSMTIS